MSSVDDTPIEHNKDYDKGDDEVWLDGRLVDTIYIDLMESNDKNNDRYLSQFADKFDYLTLKFTDARYEICYSDLKENTKNHLEDYVIDCKTHQEKYKKLNGIMPDVIARIAKQVEHRILASKISEDSVFIKANIYSIREIVSSKWTFVA